MNEKASAMTDTVTKRLKETLFPVRSGLDLLTQSAI